MSEAPEPESSREELEEERDFLLKSLDDLDGELTAGNIDPDSYRTLHDDYTARASAIIRTLADGEERARPREPNLPRVMKIVTAMAIVIFCVLIAIAITNASGQRRPGQTATGNDQVSRNTLNANTYEARITKARTALNDGDLTVAVQEFTAAARLDPTQTEPVTYRGWISALAARQVSDPKTKQELEANAAADLDRAIRLNKKYAPAYVFKGLLLVQQGKQAQAIPDFQTYLTLVPSDDPMRPTVLSALAAAVNATKKP